jgi:hypothetical protein
MKDTITPTTICRLVQSSSSKCGSGGSSTPRGPPVQSVGLDSQPNKRCHRRLGAL